MIVNEVNILDTIIGNNGRIIGVKINEVYPISGSGYKKTGIFFSRKHCVIT